MGRAQRQLAGAVVAWALCAVTSAGPRLACTPRRCWPVLSVVRLRGGQGTPPQEQEEDMESSLGLISNSDAVVDPDAPGVQAMKFTPAAQALLEEAARELADGGGVDPAAAAEPDGVELEHEPDGDFRARTSARFNALLRAHPDRFSRAHTGAPIHVTGSCADIDGSLMDYLEAAGEDVDSGNSSEFEAYLNDARAAFNRSDAPRPHRNPSEALDADMPRDVDAEAAYRFMFPPDNDPESRYRTWRAMMVTSRRARRRSALPSPQDQPQDRDQDQDQAPSTPALAGARAGAVPVPPESGSLRAAGRRGTGGGDVGARAVNGAVNDAVNDAGGDSESDLSWLDEEGEGEGEVM